jgi:Phage integrase family
VAALTGMPQGEILALRWSEIDLTARTIRVRRSYSGGRLSEQPKTKSGACTIDAPETLAALLRVWKVKCPPSKLGLCFPSAAGEHLDGGELIRRGLRPALERAGLRAIRFHDLRHGYASALLASGVDLIRVSKALGHANVNITAMTYARVISGLGAQVGAQLEQVYAALGSKVVAEAPAIVAAGGAKPAQVVDIRGVPGAGFEPARLAPRDFKSLASTSFATRARVYGRAVIGPGSVEAGVGIEPAYTALQAARYRCCSNSYPTSPRMLPRRRAWPLRSHTRHAYPNSLPPPLDRSLK